MSPMNRVITLTTDFGLSDGFPAVMKGVILSIAPDATIVDLSHDINAQDVRQGAFVLKAACRYFPPGAIHAVVVDPGVGSDRRILAIRTSTATFIGPDNGILSWALSDQQIEVAVGATDPRYWLPQVSRTFHGRDIFAPLAAYVALGVPVESFGPPVTDWVWLPMPAPRLMANDAILYGEIIHIDHFGNLITNIEVEPDSGRVRNVASDPVTLHSGVVIEASGWRVAGLRHSYAEVAPGRLLAIVGSSGYLELAVREGIAAEAVGAHIGDAVQISLNPPVET
jgi:S-adenosyl-L-methionine hydrolase (adenosine-forming)